MQQKKGPARDGRTEELLAHAREHIAVARKRTVWIQERVMAHRARRAALERYLNREPYR